MQKLRNQASDPFHNPLSSPLNPLFLLLLCGTLYLWGNGRVSLWDRDEPRYAEATREMTRSGDYIVPRFNGEPRFQKPVLVYWMMSLGTRIWGDSPFGARFGSALCGTATCLLTAALARRMFGPSTGLLAGLILALSPIMVVESKLCTTDALLTTCLTAGFAALWRIDELRNSTTEERTSSSPRPSILILQFSFWFFLGLAALAKGPVALALAGSVLGVWALLGPGRQAVRRLGWSWGPVVLLAVVLPWCVAIYGRVGWEFYREALGRQLAHRIGQPMEGHRGWPGYYLTLSFGTFFPWSLFAPLALARSWRSGRRDPRVSFALAWILGPLLVLEPVPTKLIHYYLPAYPGWAILIASGLTALIHSGAQLRATRLGRFAVTGLGLMGLALGGAVLVFGLRRLPHTLHPPLIAISLVLALGGVGAALLLAGGKNRIGLSVAGGTVAAGFLLMFGWLLPWAEPNRITHRLAERLQAATAGGVPVALGQFREPSLIYYLGGPVPILENHDMLQRFLAQHGPVLCPLGPEEWRKLHADGRFSLDLREMVTGFNLDKGRTETLYLARVAPALPEQLKTRSRIATAARHRQPDADDNLSSSSSPAP